MLVVKVLPSTFWRPLLRAARYRRAPNTGIDAYWGLFGTTTKNHIAKGLHKLGGGRSAKNFKRQEHRLDQPRNGPLENTFKLTKQKPENWATGASFYHRAQEPIQVLFLSQSPGTYPGAAFITEPGHPFERQFAMCVKCLRNIILLHHRKPTEILGLALLFETLLDGYAILK